jgi:probable rRNA maturation factor
MLQIMIYLGYSDQDLSVVFGSDRLLQDLNRTYRHQDRPTNVLAFPQSPTYEGELATPMLGDVIVALPTAAREAHDSSNLAERVVYLLLHGILHLLGHDHEGSAAQRRRMEALEGRAPAHLSITAMMPRMRNTIVMLQITHASIHTSPVAHACERHTHDGAISAPEDKAGDALLFFRMGDFYELFEMTPS